MTLNLRRRLRSHAAGRSRRIRAGISMVEIVVAMTLFGGAAVSMAGMSLVVARRAEANDVVAKRSAVLEQQMNWLQALPYDSLQSKAGTVTVAGGAFPHKRKVTLTVGTTRTRVTIQVTPTKAPTSSAVIVFDRARPTSSPLCRGC
jgi:Tfp pilus assembly protein PilV